LLGKDYFGRTGGHVLCLGAGGSTIATVLYFAHREHSSDRPERIVIVNRSADRLKRLEPIATDLHTGIQFEYYCNTEPEANDRRMEQMPPGSLVINATGMGKDTPGSPITKDGVFPESGIVWELNYRGELNFLHQALAQAARRRLTVEDGWLYFLHGWTQVLAQVLKVQVDGALFERLAGIAGQISRPALPRRVIHGDELPR